jgi:hypothetical protein
VKCLFKLGSLFLEAICVALSAVALLA